jgi:hypothetical protein
MRDTMTLRLLSAFSTNSCMQTNEPSPKKRVLDLTYLCQFGWLFNQSSNDPQHLGQ